MSKEQSAFGLNLAEKILGLLLVIIGVALTYYTYSNQSAAGMATSYFIAAGIILTILGITMLVAKTS